MGGIRVTLLDLLREETLGEQKELRQWTMQGLLRYVNGVHISYISAGRDQ